MLHAPRDAQGELQAPSLHVFVHVHDKWKCTPTLPASIMRADNVPLVHLMPESSLKLEKRPIARELRLSLPQFVFLGYAHSSRLVEINAKYCDIRSCPQVLVCPSMTNRMKHEIRESLDCGHYRYVYRTKLQTALARYFTLAGGSIVSLTLEA